MQTAEPFEVFEVYPAGFTLLVVFGRVLLGSLVVDFQEFLDYIVIAILASDVQEGLGLGVKYVAIWDCWIVIHKPLHLPGLVPLYY